MEDKIKIQKSPDFKSYFAANIGIVDSSIDGSDLYDIVILNKEASPILLNPAEEGNEWTAQLALTTEFQHVCSIRVSPMALRRLKEVIDTVLTRDEK